MGNRRVSGTRNYFFISFPNRPTKASILFGFYEGVEGKNLNQNLPRDTPRLQLGQVYLTLATVFQHFFFNPGFSIVEKGRISSTM